MSLPSKAQGYSGFPEEENVRYFRNTIIQFKKAIQFSKNIDELNEEMERFMNACRRVVWPHKTSETFRKDDGEKAVGKVVSEFQRYIADMKKNGTEATRQDLLDALTIAESVIDRLKKR